MLPGRDILQRESSWEEDPLISYADWQWFLYKASIGSDKCQYMLQYASFAYQIYLLNDADAVNDDSGVFEGQFELLFPKAAPASTVDRLAAMCNDGGWCPSPIGMMDHPFHSDDKNRSLWSRKHRPTQEHLLHDAVLFCWVNWSVESCLECMEAAWSDISQIDSLRIVSGMLYLSLTWPEDSNWSLNASDNG